MKKDKIIYYVATGLLSILLLYSAGMYFFRYDDVATMFTNFGYPTYLIYPYAVIKLLGLIALWTPSLTTIKEWAYAGYFYAFILAFFAHYMIGDGEQVAAVLAIILLVVSYIFNKRLQN
ncbi:DoxX family protein [Bizionia sp.]|uniref:DoxX family protein n=1 Tax=Bizionia sp. TaxID=1954480 RepID=UPI003A949408